MTNIPDIYENPQPCTMADVEPFPFKQSRREDLLFNMLPLSVRGEPWAYMYPVKDAQTREPHAEVTNHIYFGPLNPAHRSDGYGGGTLGFNVVGHSEVVPLYGPWHTNSNSLKATTGLDFTQRHLTWGFIAQRRIHVGNRWRYLEVLHMDPKNEEECIGSFNRIEYMAQELSNKHKIQTYFYMASAGGSIQSGVTPKEMA